MNRNVTARLHQNYRKGRGFRRNSHGLMIQDEKKEYLRVYYFVDDSVFLKYYADTFRQQQQKPQDLSSNFYQAFVAIHHALMNKSGINYRYSSLMWKTEWDPYEEAYLKSKRNEHCTYMQFKKNIRHAQYHHRSGHRTSSLSSRRASSNRELDVNQEIVKEQTAQIYWDLPTLIRSFEEKTPHLVGFP